MSAATPEARPYTDEDVEVAQDALDRFDYHPGPETQAQYVLAAVASGLVARAKAEALREAADVLFASSAADFGRIGPILTTKQSSADWLRDRADEIEAGR